MNDRLLNENAYKQVEYWKKSGKSFYISVFHYLLVEHTKNLCYPNGDEFIYFPKKYYALEDIITVLNSLEIKYSISTLPGFIAVSFN